MKTIIGFLIVGLFFCCGSRRSFDQATLFDDAAFPNRQALHGEKMRVPHDDGTVLIPQNLAVIDTFLLVVSPPYADHMVSVYSLVSGRKLGVMASSGRGPNELLLLRQIGHSDTERRFWLLDHSVHKVLIFDDKDLDQLAKTGTIAPVKTVQMELQGIANRIYFMGDTIVTCYKMAPLKRIPFLDTTGHYLSSVLSRHHDGDCIV